MTGRRIPQGDAFIISFLAQVPFDKRQEIWDKELKKLAGKIGKQLAKNLLTRSEIIPKMDKRLRPVSSTAEKKSKKVKKKT